jgi:phage/plasmid-associated DNA primase
MNSDLLNSQPSGAFKKDDALAATEGRSLLIFNEIDERMVASTQNIKDLTEGGRDEFGNKVMTVVRPAYSRNYEVNICGTPIIVANTLMNFGDWSQLDPIFKRLVMVPFDYKITKEDPSLLNRLAAEYPKIQAWLYLNYFKHKNIQLKNVPKPQVIQDRFKQYRADSDIIQMFWDDCIRVTNNKADEMMRSDIYKMYKMYCDANGRKAIKNKGTNGFQNLIQPFFERIIMVHKNGSYMVQGVKKSAYFEKEII